VIDFTRTVEVCFVVILPCKSAIAAASVHSLSSICHSNSCVTQDAQAQGVVISAADPTL
jgi:hypothetical protein